jgi:MFS family permease
MIGGWAAQIPLVKERLAVGHGALGLALLGMAAGAMIAMPLAGAAISRVGSAAVTRASTLAFCLALPLPVLAPNLVLLAMALLVFGAANGVMDVAMNAHGVAVERRLGRPIMSSCHGMFSVGGLAGAGLAALLLPVMEPVLLAGLTTAIALGIAVLALPHLLPAGVDMNTGEPAFGLPNQASLALGALCFLAMSGEGAVLDWSALHLEGELGMSPEFAAIGFAAFSATMAAGRFTGDWMRGHFGAVILVRVSAFVAAAGLTLALLAPIPALAIAGFAIVGLGVANLVPVLFGAAGALPGQSSGSAIAAVATMGYMGFLAGPPVIGLVAEQTSLQLALGLVVLACIIIGVAAAAASPAGNPAVAQPGLEPL